MEFNAIRVCAFISPHSQQPGGLIQIPRRWLRVKRNGAFGELKWRINSWRFDCFPLCSMVGGAAKLA